MILCVYMDLDIYRSQPSFIYQSSALKIWVKQSKEARRGSERHLRFLALKVVVDRFDGVTETYSSESHSREVDSFDF